MSSTSHTTHPKTTTILTTINNKWRQWVSSATLRWRWRVAKLVYKIIKWYDLIIRETTKYSKYSRRRNITWNIQNIHDDRWQRSFSSSGRGRFIIAIASPLPANWRRLGRRTAAWHAEQTSGIYFCQVTIVNVTPQGEESELEKITIRNDHINRGVVVEAASQPVSGGGGKMTLPL